MEPRAEQYRVVQLGPLVHLVLADSTGPPWTALCGRTGADPRARRTSWDVSCRFCAFERRMRDERTAP